MPRRAGQSIPQYRKHRDRMHRASGQTIVTLGGRDYYLGPHGTKASKHEYDRLLLRKLRRLYGRTPATEFGPLQFKPVRDALTTDQRSQQYVSHTLRRAVSVFR